ncbi:MAG: sigma-54 dependent transcriptional regulator [Elusimicrobiota bacterium]
MQKLKVLVVEDNPLARKLMSAELSDHDVDFAPDLVTGREKIAAGGNAICFIDLKLGDKDNCSGLELVPLAVSVGTYSVVMSGHDSEEVVERAYKLGCNDFYAKGNEAENVGAVLARFLRRRREGGEDRIFQDQFVTEDAATRASISSALKYAASDLPVIILGPSGSGKTSLAQIIHDRSGRRGQFVAINCAAYTEDLLEAELFGYRKGAFTGASDSRKGKLLMADEGTLFLDEIGSMSLKMQTKLLKAIEEKSFYPLGADRPEKSRFRVISATLEYLQELVEKGRLRFDFLQRIQGLTITLKPLMKRKDDIVPLLSFFTRSGRRLSFTEEAKQQLRHYDWPGNVRELKKFVELVTEGPSGRITLETLRELLATARSEKAPDAFLTEPQYRFILENGLDSAVKRFVDAAIQRNLADNKGRKTKVLSALHISTGLLYTSLRRTGGHGRTNDGK